MKAFVDKDACIGCGLCPSIDPDVFDMGDDGKAYVVESEVPSESEDTVVEAEEACPVDAIRVEH